MNTPTPVTVVTAEQLDLVAPGNIVEAFKQLPQFLGNVDATQNNGIGTDAGQSILNMRDLGGNRTLVLLDGRRMVPSTYNGTVDINVMPQSLLKRTEVVTGGASAAYGTDAVAGVVNFILDTNYTGLKGRVQGGITAYGDGANKEGELTFGTAHRGEGSPDRLGRLLRQQPDRERASLDAELGRGERSAQPRIAITTSWHRTSVAPSTPPVD